MAQIRNVPTSALILPPSNPNKMRETDQDLLSEGVAHLHATGLTSDDVSLLQPVLVREDDAGRLHVIDGVHRVTAAIAASFASVPAVVVRCTEKQASLLQIGMNKIRGALDYRETAEALQRLLDGPGADDAILTGHAPSALDDLLGLDLRTDVDLDLSEEPVAPQERIVDPAARPFALPEISFRTRAERDTALRGLKKAGGGGRSPDLAAGLLRLVKG